MDVRVEVASINCSVEFQDRVFVAIHAFSLGYLVASSTDWSPFVTSALLSSSGFGLHSPPGWAEKKANRILVNT